MSDELISDAQQVLLDVNPQVIGTWRVSDCLFTSGWDETLEIQEVQELLERIQKLLDCGRLIINAKKSSRAR
jgi:hypothetical protein